MRMVRAALVAVAVYVLCGGAAPLSVAADDPAAIFTRLVAAGNRGDVEAVVALFAEDATLKIAVCQTTPCVGRDAIRREFERQRSIHTTRAVLNTQVTGDTLVTRYEIRNDLARSAGEERIILVGTVITRGDKIVFYGSIDDLSDPDTVGYVEHDFVPGFVPRRIGRG